ncbi:MAG: four helix bundle protein [Alphaproteobacteria bacterium]|nr:four helix bundle protein [Alphaproteobacteria bacterium]
MSSENATKNYKELLVWKKARGLVKIIYQLAGLFPQEERYGLISQIRRAAVSIAVNIAEGFGRNASKEFAHFASIAYGSATEVEALLILAVDLGYIDEGKTDVALAELDEVLRMLNKLRQSLRASVAA